MLLNRFFYVLLGLCVLPPAGMVLLTAMPQLRGASPASLLGTALVFAILLAIPVVLSLAAVSAAWPARWLQVATGCCVLTLDATVGNSMVELMWMDASTLYFGVGIAYMTLAILLLALGVFVTLLAALIVGWRDTQARPGV